MTKWIITAIMLAGTIPGPAQNWQVEIRSASTDPAVRKLSTSGAFTTPNIQVCAVPIRQQSKNSRWFDSRFQISFASSSAAGALTYSDVHTDETVPPDADYSVVGPAPGDYLCNFPNSTESSTMPRCLGDFLTSSPHPPVNGYSGAHLQIIVRNLDFTAIPVNGLAEGPAEIQLAIFPKSDCSSDYTGIGVAIASIPAQLEGLVSPAKVARTSDKVWEITVSQPVPIIPWGYYKYYGLDRKGRSTEYCSSYHSASAVWIKQVAFTLVLTQI